MQSRLVHSDEEPKKILRVRAWRHTHESPWWATPSPPWLASSVTMAPSRLVDPAPLGKIENRKFTTHTKKWHHKLQYSCNSVGGREKGCWRRRFPHLPSFVHIARYICNRTRPMLAVNLLGCVSGDIRKLSITQSISTGTGFQNFSNRCWKMMWWSFASKE